VPGYTGLAFVPHEQVLAGQKPLCPRIRPKGTVVREASLECLSKPALKLVQTDQGTAQQRKGIMEIDSPLIARGEPPHPAQPGKGSFDNPAMAPEPLTILDTSTSNAGLNTPPAAR